MALTMRDVRNSVKNAILADADEGSSVTPAEEMNVLVKSYGFAFTLKTIIRNNLGE